MSDTEPMKCTDGRCLYRADGESLPASASLITTETREGPGRWERCDHCGLAINRQGVEADDQEAYYNDEYLRTHSFVAGEVLDPAEHFRCRVDAMRATADGLIPHLQADMRLLEIGCGAGELLYHLLPHVREVMANEIIQSFVDYVAESLQVPSTSQDYLTIDFDRPFDCIISINTIDHIHDTRRIVEKMYADLAPGGLLYLEVPNDGQALRTQLPGPGRQGFQAFMYQRAHYYSFSPSALERLTTDVGFTVDQTWSRHDYSILNYLNWYFCGKPQGVYKVATGSPEVHDADSAFGRDMNALMADTDRAFREIMATHKMGETTCLVARKPKSP